MITVHRWDYTSRACARVAPDHLPKTAAELPAEDVVWIDLTDPTPDEEGAVLGRFLPVHALTLGDITKPRREPDQGAHFPKVEEFPDYLFVVTNPLPPELLPGPGLPGTRPPNPAVVLAAKNRPQLSAVLTRNVLVTHHYAPIGCVGEVVRHLGRHADAARRGPDYLFHLLLDAMVDEYAPVVDRLAARLDRIEARVFKDPSPALLGSMLRIKRAVTGLRKTVILEREVLARLTRGEFSLVDEREVAYYRNVYDHLARYSDLIEAARETVADLMQSHLAAASNRLNGVMKVLTMISTLVLPMTLVAGIYGMNFEENVWPGFKTEWGFGFAIGTMLATGFGSLALFRWKRWV